MDFGMNSPTHSPSGEYSMKTSGDLRTLSIGLVHDWLPLISGAERVIEQMLNCLPRTEIYTLFNFLGSAEQEIFGQVPIHTSSLNKLPGVRKYYRQILLLCMRAIENFDVSKHDLIVSSSAALSKGVITRTDQPHISYIHSPARYAWDLTHQYISSIDGRFALLKRAIAREIMHRFRIWDMRTANSPDLLLANSRFIQKRIFKVYRRPSIVLYPPVNISAFDISSGARDEYFITASRLVPYKRIDLIVSAFSRMPDRKLLVIGDGPEMSKIKALAAPNIELLGYQPFDSMVRYFQQARAFVFAAQEDFGIVPVEAQACGTPVIALGEGGTAETVIGLGDGFSAPTGVLFRDQSVESICEAVLTFDSNANRFDDNACRAHALQFSEENFRARFIEILQSGLSMGFNDTLASALTSQY